MKFVQIKCFSAFNRIFCVENDGTYETDLQISSDVIVGLYRRSTGTVSDIS